MFCKQCAGQLRKISKYLQIQTWGLRRWWVWRHSWALTKAAGSAKERTAFPKPSSKSWEETTEKESWARQSSGLALVFTSDVDRKKSTRDDSSNVAMRMLYTVQLDVFLAFLRHSLFTKVNLPQELIILTVCATCAAVQFSVWTSVVTSSGHTGNPLQLRCILGFYEAQGPFPGAEGMVEMTLAAKISASGHWTKALSTLHNAVSPEERDYAAAITSCLRSLRWTWALHLLDDTLSSHLRMGEATWNKIVSAAGRQKSWQAAIRLFGQYPENRAASLDVQHYFAILCHTLLHVGEMGLDGV